MDGTSCSTAGVESGIFSCLCCAVIPGHPHCIVSNITLPLPSLLRVRGGFTVADIQLVWEASELRTGAGGDVAPQESGTHGTAENLTAGAEARRSAAASSRRAVTLPRAQMDHARAGRAHAWHVPIARTRERETANHEHSATLAKARGIVAGPARAPSHARSCGPQPSHRWPACRSEST